MMGDICAVGKENSAVQEPHPRKAGKYNAPVLVPSVPFNNVIRARAQARAKPATESNERPFAHS